MPGRQVLGSAGGSDHDVVDPLAPAVEHAHRPGLLDLGHNARELLRVGDLDVVDRQDHVAFTQAYTLYLHCQLCNLLQLRHQPFVLVLLHQFRLTIRRQMCIIN